MRHRNLIVASLAFAGLTLLAACGGGGGGGTPPAGGGGGPTPCPAGYTGTAPNCIAPSTTTNATGRLVDDASNTPLAGIRVVLKPWVANATPLPSPQTTTAPDGSFTLANATNGHYLLVIGSDLPSDTTRATVHDNVTLSGGNQALVAPTLLPIPGFTPPPSETGGNYRLATMDATTELPCFARFNSDRANVGQPSVPLDEWATENEHGQIVYVYSPQFAGKAYDLTPLWAGNVSGDVSCNHLVDSGFPGGQATYGADARVGWYGGIYVNRGNTGGQAGTNHGGDTSPFDPRTYTDPTWPVWP